MSIGCAGGSKWMSPDHACCARCAGSGTASGCPSRRDIGLPDRPCHDAGLRDDQAQLNTVPQPGFMQRTVSSLRSRNFRLFFTGQTISNTGNWLTMVALTLLVLHRGGSGVAVGILAACQLGPILVLSPWAGVVVDRMDKRRLLLITQ